MNPEKYIHSICEFKISITSELPDLLQFSKLHAKKLRYEKMNNSYYNEPYYIENNMSLAIQFN